MFRSIAEALPVGIALADPAGSIIYGNAALSRRVHHPVLLSESPEKYDEWESYHSDGRRVSGPEYPLARVLREGADRSVLDVH